MVDDSFGTSDLRQRVLDAWAVSPARFREDANSEEDLFLGPYRDRLVIELAQNAADAALRSGVPGRLRFILKDQVLFAANTGAPLDTDGVEALSTLRASAKRDEPEAVGRFGVGFATVLAVSDEPLIRSSSGAVRWSREATLDIARSLPSLGDELSRRGRSVPVLRLPFAAPGRPAAGYDTEVVLPLRDDSAVDLTRRLLKEIGPALLIALPGLTAVEVEVDGTHRRLGASWDGDSVKTDIAEGKEHTTIEWLLAREGGELSPDLLVGRPMEERTRPTWSVTWAVPVAADSAPQVLPDSVPAVLHAPTPSDERIGLSALLLASFPLAPDRHHIAPSALTDFLIERAVEAYIALFHRLPSDPSLLSLVPGRVAESELDARIRRGVLAALPDTPFLPDGLRPRDAVVLDDPAATPLTDLLTPVLDGLLPGSWPARSPALAELGVRRLGLAEMVDTVAGLGRDPEWWRELYSALGPVDPRELGALPVPLADGRLVRGPRGLLIAGEGAEPGSLSALGIRVVHADAAHPLLTRLGAVEANPRTVLGHETTRAAVAASMDEEDPWAIAEAVLGLVASAGIEPGELPWLADLGLPDTEGEFAPASELVLPGGPLDEVLDHDAPFGAVSETVVERFGRGVCEAIGVLRTFAVVREDDVPLDPSAMDHDLHAEAEWAGQLLRAVRPAEVPPLVSGFVAVRDLDFVDRWEVALALLAEEPYRTAVTEPAVVVSPDGSRTRLPSYTSWWLARNPVLGGRRPREFRLRGADDRLAELYPDAPPGLDSGFLAAIGVRTGVPDLLAEPGGPDELLGRLADPNASVDRETLHALLIELASVNADRVTPPERVRSLIGNETRVVPAEDVVVIDAPDLLPLFRDRPVLLVPYDLAEALAGVLGLDLASEAIDAPITTAGQERAVPRQVRDVLPAAPGSYIAHDRLLVGGEGPEQRASTGHELPWRAVDGVVHASEPAGLARGLAWVCGRWEDRMLVEQALRSPERLGGLLAERDLERTKRVEPSAIAGVTANVDVPHVPETEQPAGDAGDARPDPQVAAGSASHAEGGENEQDHEGERP